MVSVVVVGESGGGGGRLHLTQEAAPDHVALLLCPEHTAVQEEDGSAGAAAGLHAGPGVCRHSHSRSRTCTARWVDSSPHDVDRTVDDVDHTDSY